MRSAVLTALALALIATSAGAQTVYFENFSSDTTQNYAYLNSSDSPSVSDPLINTAAIDPFWLDASAFNGVITKCTGSGSCFPGNPITSDASGVGYFLFENTGADNYDYNGNRGPNTFFASSTFSVTPNTNYTVSFELANATTCCFAAVEVDINGVPVGTAYAGGPSVNLNGNTIWQIATFNWNSGSSNTAHLELLDLNPAGYGNDFGVDNISVAVARVINGAFRGNLTVPAGQNLIINGTIIGDMTQTGGTVTLQNGSITGNLHMTGGNLSIGASTLINDMEISGPSSFSIGPGTSIGGNLNIHDLPVSAGAFNTVVGATIRNDMTLQNSATSVAIGWGAGSPSNDVGGNLAVRNNLATTLVTNNVVHNDLHVQNNTALLQDFTTVVSNNVVTNNLHVQNNTIRTQIFDDFVGNNLQCQNNSSITGGGNTVGGSKQGQCAGF
jgi:hypothetical protein